MARRTPPPIPEKISVEIEVPQQVYDGITLLDKEAPTWWEADPSDREPIDLIHLDLGSTDRCILGQIYGDYSTGKHELGLTYGSDYGFDQFDDITDHELTGIWRSLIEYRRREAR